MCLDSTQTDTLLGFPDNPTDPMSNIRGEPDPLKPQDPYELGLASLQAQLKLAPDVLAANQQYAPQYNALNSQLLNQTLFGTTSFDAASALQNDPWAIASRAQINKNAAHEGISPEEWLTRHITANSGDPTMQAIQQQYTQPNGGLLTAYQKLVPALGDLQTQANTQQRSADIADVASLGAQAVAAYQAANPELAAAMKGLQTSVTTAAGQAAPQITPAQAQAGTLGPAAQATAQQATAAQATAQQAGMQQAATQQAGMQRADGGPLLGQLQTDAAGALNQLSPLQQQLQQQASAQLATGGALTPDQLRQVQQDTRGAYAARGLYDSNQAIGAEILNTDAARQARLQQAQAFAGNVDAAGQQQINAARGYAGSVQAQGQNLSQTNAGIYTQNQQYNAGQANANNQYNAGLYTQNQQYNAGQANQLAAQNAAAQTSTSQYNAGQANQLAGQNASAQNAYGLAQFGQDATTSQYNAGQDYQTQLANAGLTLQNQQQGIQNQFNLASLYGQQAQDPYQLVLGRSGAVAQAGGAAQQGVGATGTANVFDPFNNSIMSIYSGNTANQLAQQTANANNQAAQNSANTAAAATILAAFFCKVAREVYGPQAREWRIFRVWLLTQGSARLRARYLAKGGAIAAWLHGRPDWKARIRRWMDGRIAEQRSLWEGGAHAGA
jgi:hypothetical protein